MLRLNIIIGALGQYSNLGTCICVTDVIPIIVRNENDNKKISQFAALRRHQEEEQWGSR